MLTEKERKMLIEEFEGIKCKTQTEYDRTMAELNNRQRLNAMKVKDQLCKWSLELDEMEIRVLEIQKAKKMLVLQMKRTEQEHLEDKRIFHELKRMLAENNPAPICPESGEEA